MSDRDDSLLDALERLRRDTGGVDLPIPPRDDPVGLVRAEGLFAGDGDELTDGHSASAGEA